MDGWCVCVDPFILHIDLHMSIYTNIYIYIYIYIHINLCVDICRSMCKIKGSTQGPRAWRCLQTPAQSRNLNDP